MVGAWEWENATAGGVAGFATVAAMHPLDVVRTRFQVNDGRGLSALPTYKNTAHALFTIARLEVSSLLSSVPLFPGAYTSSFMEERNRDTVEAGTMTNSPLLFTSLLLLKLVPWSALLTLIISLSQPYYVTFFQVCFCTNPIWLVKTRLQLQTPLHQTPPYSGLLDAFRTIIKEEGPRALYKGILPALLLVSHGAIQFTAYEELRKLIVDFKDKRRNSESTSDNLLNSADYAALGGSSKVAAVLLTYPFQVIRARLQQRPSTNGVPRYIDSLHVIRETARFEGLRGFYRGLTANLLKNVPASSITFIVYENVLKLLKQPPTK